MMTNQIRFGDAFRISVAIPSVEDAQKDWARYWHSPTEKPPNFEDKALEMARGNLTMHASSYEAILTEKGIPAKAIPDSSLITKSGANPQKLSGYVVFDGPQGNHLTQYNMYTALQNMIYLSANQKAPQPEAFTQYVSNQAETFKKSLETQAVDAPNIIKYAEMR